MQISLVVAAASNNAIGLNGTMPWHLPADLRHFKNTTWGLPIIMGRKTFESLGKPLPGRTNIIISRQQTGSSSLGAIKWATTPEQALTEASADKTNEVMVIGGGEIYKLFFSQASRIYLTRVEATPEADTYFPAIHPDEWKLLQQIDREADEKNSFNYSFQTWERKAG
jgi:dihydrofolate reductase